MLDFYIQIFSDHTLRVVVAGALILGMVSGVLGAFAVLRRQSLLGDAISHATLPGVCLAFILTQSKSPLVLIVGAALAGWIGTLCITTIVRNSRIKYDTALGMILSVFFGIGLVLLTIIQKMPTAAKSGLDKFLFGSAATLLREDVWTMAVLGVVCLGLVVVLWKEFKLFVFDQEYARSIGLPVYWVDIMLTSLTVVAIVIGLQMVGVVLMSAMLVAPAAAARQWTDRFSVMVFLSALFGVVCGIGGALTSSLVEHLPTGPVIVVYLSVFVLVSLFLAPHRGLAWDWLRAWRYRQYMHTTAMLKNLLLFSESHTDPFHPHDIAALRAIGRGTVRRTMLQLLKKGWVQRFEKNRWALTQEGLRQARQVTVQYEEGINP